MIEEWAELQRTVVMNQQEVQSCEEKILKAQKNIDDLYTKMAELSSVNHLNPKDISSLDDLQQKMEAIQVGISHSQKIGAFLTNASGTKQSLKHIHMYLNVDLVLLLV